MIALAIPDVAMLPRAAASVGDSTAVRPEDPADRVDSTAVRPAVDAVDLADTAAVRFEVGVGTDLTNEQFYEDALIDSISLGRRLVDSPEARIAAVWFGSLTGTRGGRTVAYQLQNELSLGDKIRRDLLSGSWRAELSPDWRLHVFPRFEYRRDRTFDRDLEEWRGSAMARLRRGLGDGVTFLDLQGGGELLRTSGAGADFLLDRNAARAGIGVERAPLFGAEWRLDYTLQARVFPDSSERDHLEHTVAARWRRDFEGGPFLLAETEVTRRSTMQETPTSRDRFWQTEGSLEAGLGPREGLGWRARTSAEALRYDVEDDILFFDYQVVRARVGPRIERGRWTLGGGPRGELLRSPRDPGEQYREIGGGIELEFLGHSGWWSATPAAGWRDYSESGAGDSTGGIGLHSSYAFYEIGLLADQSLPGALRVRLFASARLEAHLDPAEDARSLYFSLDVRRLF